MEETKKRVLREGESVLLYRKGQRSLPVILSRGPKMLGESGVVDLTAAIGLDEGSTFPVAGTDCTLLRPTLRDLYRTWPRATQIITPKDASHILYLGDIGPGARVLEAGTGSGLLTLFLARAVGPEGWVVSYDRRPEHQKVAKENLERSGMASRVTLKAGDVGMGFEETGVDAVVLDVPEPWALIGPAVRALRVGGSLVTYSPTYNQLEKTVRALREGPFGEVLSVELLERPLHVGEGGTRPSFEMLGHTGFITGARKVSGP